MSEWIAYAKTNPFSEKRADLRSAIIAWTVAMVFSSGKSKLTPEDFMLNFGEPKKVESMDTDVMWNMLKSMAKKE